MKQNSTQNNQIWGVLQSLNKPKYQDLNLTQQKNTIGRNPNQNTFYLDDIRLSNIHCEITRLDKNKFQIQDNSSNGTYVNDVKIGKGKSINLKDNDRICLLKPSNKVKEQDAIIYCFIDQEMKIEMDSIKRKQNEEELAKQKEQKEKEEKMKKEQEKAQKEKEQRQKEEKEAHLRQIKEIEEKEKQLLIQQKSMEQEKKQMEEKMQQQIKEKDEKNKQQEVENMNKQLETMKKQMEEEMAKKQQEQLDLLKQKHQEELEKLKQSSLNQSNNNLAFSNNNVNNLNSNNNGLAQSNMGTVVDDMYEEFECCICMEIIYQCVSLNPCLHNMCGACACDWLLKKDQCPTCNEKVTKVRKNPVLNNLIQKYISKHPEKKWEEGITKSMDEKNKIKDIIELSIEEIQGKVVPKQQQQIKKDQQSMLQQQQQRFKPKPLAQKKKYTNIFGQDESDDEDYSSEDEEEEDEEDEEEDEDEEEEGGFPGFIQAPKKKKMAAGIGKGGIPIGGFGGFGAGVGVGGGGFGGGFGGFGGGFVAPAFGAQIPVPILHNKPFYSPRSAICQNCDKRFNGPKSDKDQCSLCFKYFCNQKRKCDGQSMLKKLKLLKDYEVPKIIHNELFKENINEVKILKKYLREKDLTTNDIFRDQILDKDENFQVYYSKMIHDCYDGQNVYKLVNRNSMVCGTCFIKDLWFQICFRYKKKIKPELEFPDNFTEVCPYGLNCRTSKKDKEHQINFDHCDLQTKP